jgi:hypothetical protein
VRRRPGGPDRRDPPRRRGARAIHPGGKANAIVAESRYPRAPGGHVSGACAPAGVGTPASRRTSTARPATRNRRCRDHSDRPRRPNGRSPVVRVDPRGVLDAGQAPLMISVSRTWAPRRHGGYAPAEPACCEVDNGGVSSGTGNVPRSARPRLSTGGAGWPCRGIAGWTRRDRLTPAASRPHHHRADLPATGRDHRCPETGRAHARVPAGRRHRPPRPARSPINTPPNQQTAPRSHSHTPNA